MKTTASRFGICLALCFALLTSLRADVKIRPGDKPKESTKDFMKDVKKNGYPTPEPRDRAFSFTEGLSVEIELEVATSSLGGVKFAIRDAPQHGKLSEIRVHPSGESNKALVTYTHGGNREALMDRFTFNARLAEGGNSSAPGTITLIGKAAAPRIDVLEIGQFKRLEPGGQDAQRIVVMNSGTAPFTTEIKWPAPFVGPSKLELGINEKQTFMLMVKVTAPGAYRLDVDLQPGVTTSRVQAYVECIQPFNVTPGAVTLAFDASAGNRTGVVRVSNGSESPLKLRLDAPARLLVPKELLLEPKSAQDLKLTIDAKDVALFRGELWFIQEPGLQKVVVHAEPEPPQLALVSPKEGKIEFGKIEKGKKGEALITLTNGGGQPALLKVLTLPAPFSLPAGEPESIPAGGTLQLALAFTPTQPGDYKGALGIGGNGGQVQIAMSGSMFDPTRPSTSPTVGNPHSGPVRPTAQSSSSKRRPAGAADAATATPSPIVPATLAIPPPSPAPAAPPAEDASSTAELIDGKPSLLSAMQKLGEGGQVMQAAFANFGLGVETLPQFKSTILERVPMIGASDIGRDYVVIGWQEPKTEPSQYLLQRSRMRVNEQTGLPFKSWEIVKDWKPVKAPTGIVAARVDGLAPGYEYEWRVLGVDSEGKLSPSSDFLRVFTLPPLRVSFWLVTGLLGALLAIAVLVTKRVREQRMLAV